MYIYIKYLLFILKILRCFLNPENNDNSDSNDNEIFDPDKNIPPLRGGGGGMNQPWESHSITQYSW